MAGRACGMRGGRPALPGAAARLRLLALAAAALLGFAGAAAAQPAPAAAGAPAAAAAAASPLLTAQDVLFAVHRMAETEPDFRALAARLVAAVPVREGARDPAAERRYLVAITARRLRAEFEAFDLDRPFAVELGADILGHDHAIGGIPVDLGARPALLLRHPLDGRPFELRLRNAEAVRVIPTPDAAAAAGMLRGAGLASIGDWAGPGQVRLTIVFAGLPPRIPEVEAVPVLAEILSATVEGATGAVLHRFPRIGSVAAAAAARAAEPVLRSAALEGVRIGMALAEAEAIAAQAFPERLGDAFYLGLPEIVRRWGVRPDCSAGVVADIRAFAVPLAAEDSYAACLALLPGAPEGPLAGRVAEVTRLRFLPDATEAEVRADLQERLGPPLEELAHGDLVWVGRDPAGGAAEGMLELRALHVPVAEGGPRREEGQLLSLTLRRLDPAGDSGS